MCVIAARVYRTSIYQEGLEVSVEMRIHQENLTEVKSSFSPEQLGPSVQSITDINKKKDATSLLPQLSRTEAKILRLLTDRAD